MLVTDSQYEEWLKNFEEPYKMTMMSYEDGSLTRNVNVSVSFTKATASKLQKLLAGIAMIAQFDREASFFGDGEEVWCGCYSEIIDKMQLYEVGNMNDMGWFKDDYYDMWNFKLGGGEDNE